MTVRCFGIKPLVGVDLHFEPPIVHQSGGKPGSSENCDHCGRRVPTREIQYNGRCFLCRDCLKLAPAEPESLLVS